MCNTPVTLGGGITIVKGSRPSGSEWKYRLSSQWAYHFFSISAGVYVFDNSIGCKITKTKSHRFRIFVDVKKVILAVIGVAVLTGFVQAQTTQVDTCRFVSYNVLNFDNTGNAKEAYLRSSISYMLPDILVVQELKETGGANRFRDSVMEKIDTAYAMAEFINSYDTDNGLYYRADKYTFLSNTPIHTELRDINQFHMQHTASGIDFYVYSVHLKASSGTTNADQRKREVDSLRKATLLLPDTAHIIVCGDFNIYGSNETGYLALIDDTQPGFVVDIFKDSLTTTWNNAANAHYHTQSTRLDAFGGGSTGGMDDRFDMILMSPSILDTGGMAYLENSFISVGNDGIRYNSSLISPANIAVPTDIANALYYTSDHIPVFSNFTFTYTETPVDTTQDTTIDTTVFVMEPLLPVLQLYPNPVDVTLQVDADAPIQLYAIFAIDGSLMFTGNAENDNTTAIPVGDLPKGVYLLQVFTDKGFGASTFIKK